MGHPRGGPPRPMQVRTSPNPLPRFQAERRPAFLACSCGRSPESFVAGGGGARSVVGTSVALGQRVDPSRSPRLPPDGTHVPVGNEQLTRVRVEQAVLRAVWSVLRIPGLYWAVVPRPRVPPGIDRRVIQLAVGCGSLPGPAPASPPTAGLPAASRPGTPSCSCDADRLLACGHGPYTCSAPWRWPYGSHLAPPSAPHCSTSLVRRPISWTRRD